MGLSYHFSFKAPAKAKPEHLEQFLKTVEASAKEMGFEPTMVLDAPFDTPERKHFARRLGTGFRVEDERLKGVALPADGVVWHHDPVHGTARVIPAKGVVLVVTDERHCESIFGFFRYPEDILDVNGEAVAKTGLANEWTFREFLDSPDPRFRKIVRMFAEAGYLESEKDEFAG